MCEARSSGYEGCTAGPTSQDKPGGPAYNKALCNKTQVSPGTPLQQIMLVDRAKASTMAQTLCATTLSRHGEELESISV